MKNCILAFRLRERLQEISIAENINSYCHTLEMRKKCTAYTKSRKKPICCKINENNFHNFHNIHDMVIFQQNEISGRSLNTLQSEMRLSDIFFTYLPIFPFLLLIILYFLAFFRRPFLQISKFVLPLA